MPKRRDWTEGRAKVDAEGACRLCGDAGALDSAHVVPRSHNPTEANMDARGIIPLCRSCHRAFDANEISVLEVLTVEEQAWAVLMAGGLVNAMQRTTSKREPMVTFNKSEWKR